SKLIKIPWMRSTTRGSLSFCAWRRTSSSLEMVALFPFANVGRILPIIAHFSEYVELFMRTYIEGIGAEAEEGVAAAGDEGSDGFALEVAGLAQQCGKFRAGADAVQPGVTHHRGIAEETVVDGAGEHLQKRWRRVESESNSRITFRATTRR